MPDICRSLDVFNPQRGTALPACAPDDVKHAHINLLNQARANGNSPFSPIAFGVSNRPDHFGTVHGVGH